MSSPRSWRAPLGLGLALACACCLSASAQWSSVRANNRGASVQRSAPRMAQPAARARGGEAARPSFRSGDEHHEADQFRGGEHEFQRGRIGERTGREFFEHRDFEHREPERRHWDFDEDRHHAYPWFGINPGMVISVLPPGYNQIYVGGNPYYYDQGLYYQPGPSGYVVVNPPVGAMVPQLPPGAEPIQIGPTVYYYAGGAFYVQQPQGFLVVTPPPGVTVTTLPPGAVPTYLNGTLYYQADGAYFLPMIQGGITVYTTVQP